MPRRPGRPCGRARSARIPGGPASGRRWPGSGCTAWSLFATPAAIAVQNAQVLAQSKRLVDRLNVAVSTRATIDRAVGILMSRSGVTEGEALQRLRTWSQHEDKKLVVIAEGVVDEAVRRARGRRQDRSG